MRRKDLSPAGGPCDGERVTAEIVVMNKLAVAMAADSAVTISTARGAKTYNTVNKLFSLSRHHPVGVMVYNNADLMGVPWELLIKLYREQLGTSSYSTVREYLDGLVSFVESRSKLFTLETTTKWIQTIAFDIAKRIHQRRDQAMEERLSQGGDITPEFVRELTIELLAVHEKRAAGAKPLDTLSPIRASWPAELEKAMDETSAKMAEALEIQSEAGRFKELLRNTVFNEVNTELYTGIVIAGYGTDEHYPVMTQMSVEAVVEGRLRVCSRDLLAVSDDESSIVQAFAQHDMANSFMEGIDPQFSRFRRSYLQRLTERLPDALAKGVPNLSPKDAQTASEKFRVVLDGLVADYEQAIARYANENHVAPVLNAVALLSKDDLAGLAESLVNLTSLKRRISLDLETVGGPIDVAVISKADGLIWIKRKHYFDPALNPAYFAKLNQR